MSRLLPSSLMVALLSLTAATAFASPVRNAAPTTLAQVAAEAGVPTFAAVHNELCGRGLGGRCLKGRQACARGTPEQCARWMTWNKACEACAKKLVKCRHRVGNSPRYTCDRCIAEHDACEAKLRGP